jgi:hypothetical protein
VKEIGEEKSRKSEKEREQGKRESPLNVIFISFVLSGGSIDERTEIKRDINISPPPFIFLPHIDLVLT